MLIYCVRIYTNRIHKNMALWVKQVFVIFALLIPQLEATGISNQDGFSAVEYTQCTGTPYLTFNTTLFQSELQDCLEKCEENQDCATVTISYSNNECLLFAEGGCNTTIGNNSYNLYNAVVCPDPPEVVNGELQPISDDNYYFGDVPQYNCSSNYTLVTDDFKCGATATTGQWEGTLKCEYDEYYECDIKCFTVAASASATLQCSADFEIFIIWANFGWDSTFQCEEVNGSTVDCINASYNQQAKDNCNGVQICGLDAIEDHSCLSGGQYIQGEYKCVQNLGAAQEICDSHSDCYTYNLTDGEASVNNGKEGATVNMTCNVGYTFDGLPSGVFSLDVKCLANGTLESDVPTCSVIHCPVLEAPADGNISINDTEYLTEVIYSCNVGYEMNTTNDTKVCQSSGKWNPEEDVSCSIVHCPILDAPENGNISKTNTEYLTEVTYTCDVGYELNTTNGTKVCQSSGKWNPEEDVSCTIVNCPVLETPENGNISNNNTEYLIEVTYTCDVGYELNTTNSTKVCQSSGKWNPEEDVSCSIVLCPVLQVPENGNISKNDNTYLTEVTYTCDVGYEMNTTNDTKVCQSSGKWNPEEDVSCSIVHCPILEIPANGNIARNNTEYLTEVTYTCDVGYELNTTNDTKFCQSSGKWNPEEDVACLIVRCLSLQVPENGNLSKNDTEYLTEVTYTCGVGYELNTTNVTTVCQSSGKWNPEEDVSCSMVHCPILEAPTNGNISTNNTAYLTEVTYTCDVGYELNATNFTKVCQSSGKWIPEEDVSCSIVHCPILEVPENGNISRRDTEYLTEVTYTCDVGYELNAANDLKVCQSSGKWNPDGDASCSIISCGSLNVADGSFMSPKGTNFGNEATIACNEGYRIDGNSSKVVACTLSGIWTSVGDCIIVNCEDQLVAPGNGTIDAASTTYGSVVTFTCQTGYILQGDRNVTCLSNGKWNGKSPSCHLPNQYNAIINIQTSLDCDDFNEKSIENLLAVATITIKEQVQEKIETLSDNVTEIVMLTVVGVRCSSPLSFVVEVVVGNLLNVSDTMSQVNQVLEDIAGDSFTVRQNDGSILNIDVQDISLGENQGYECSSGYYADIKSETCLPCPKNTFQPQGLKELCWPCPPEKVTDGVATYGNEDTVCKAQGDRSLQIGLGIGMPIILFSVMWIMVGFLIHKKTMKRNQHLERKIMQRRLPVRYYR